MAKTSKGKGGDVLKLYYFSARARAEPLRMCLMYADVPYENVQVSFEDWGKSVKQEAPFGQLPFIVHQGQKYGESKAVASFIARMCNLAGKTPEHAMTVDAVYCLASTLLENFGKSRFEKDPQKLAEIMQNLTDVTFPKYLRMFENLLKQTGDGYFVDSALSLADFAAFDITYSLLKTNPKVLDDFPQVRKMRENVLKDPKVKSYLASRPETDF